VPLLSMPLKTPSFPKEATVEGGLAGWCSLLLLAFHSGMLGGLFAL